MTVFKRAQCKRHSKSPEWRRYDDGGTVIGRYKLYRERLNDNRPVTRLGRSSNGSITDPYDYPNKWLEASACPKTFAGSRRVSPATNEPSPCSPIVQRTAMCPRRVPSPLEHGKPCRRHGTATLAHRVPTCVTFLADGGARCVHTA